MSSPADGNATIVVIMTEPGLVYVKVAEPMPRPDRIEPLLRKTIDHWFGAHPQFVIDRSEAVVENDTMRGIHVWYHVKDLGRSNSDQPPEEPDSILIVIHRAVRQRWPAEYIEAVVDEALQIFSASEDYSGTLCVISPRRIAVVLDGRACIGLVIPVEVIEQVIEGSRKKRLQTWLAEPWGRLYQMHIAGSAFERD
jgi:hypothetical protein